MQSVMPLSQAHNIDNITQYAKKIRTETMSDVLGTDFHFSGEKTTIQLYLEAYYEEILKSSYEHDNAVVIGAQSKYNLALSEETTINSKLDAIQTQMREVKLKKIQLRGNLFIKNAEFDDITQYHRMTSAAAQNSGEFGQANKESAIKLGDKEAEITTINEELANLDELLKILEIESTEQILLLQENNDASQNNDDVEHKHKKQKISQ